jgi:hypothetical protein
MASEAFPGAAQAISDKASAEAHADPLRFLQMLEDKLPHRLDLRPYERGDVVWLRGSLYYRSWWEKPA